VTTNQQGDFTLKNDERRISRFFTVEKLSTQASKSKNPRRKFSLQSTTAGRGIKSAKNI